MPSMRKWIDAAVAQFRGRSERRAAIALHARILPADLQADLLEGIRAERQRILARVQVIDESMARLEAMREEVRRVQRAAFLPVIPARARARIRLDGSRSERPAPSAPACFTIGPAALAAGQTKRAIERHLAQYRGEKLGRTSELGELARLECQVEADLLSALVRICEGWRMPVLLGGLVQRVRLGGSFSGYADAAGNLLPLEALASDGKPDLPKRLPRPVGPLVT